MEKQTLMHSSIIAAIIIAAAVGVGMVTGFSGVHPFASADPVSDSETGGQSGITGTTAADAVQYIRIDPIADKTTGDLLIISGSTNLPTGTILMIDAGNTGGGAKVRAGTAGLNRFSSPVDTSVMKPGTMKIEVTNMVGDLEKGEYRMGDINATASFVLKGTYLTTDTPVKAKTTKDDFIRINAVGDRSIGDLFLVTGTTSLPVGTEFLWEVTPASLLTDPNQSGTMTGSMGNSQVTKGTGNSNRVSFAMDTFALLPERYNVTISTVAGNLSQGDFTTADPKGTIFFTLKQGPASVDSGQYIKINPVSDKTTGDLLIISGTTSMPAGTNLMISTGNYGGNTQVRAGTDGVNLFSSPVDTTAMKPGMKTITVNNMVGDPARGDYGPGTVRTTTSFILNGPYLTTDSPVEAMVRNGDYLHLNPIGDRSTRDQFVISGTTSLPVGTEVFWQIIPDTGTPPAGINKSSTGIMANGQVTKGDGTENRVSLAVDMNGFSPGKWVAQAGDLKGEPNSGNFEMGDVTGIAYFTLT